MAVGLFSDMQRGKLQPSAVTYNSILSACGTNSWELSVALASEMEKAQVVLDVVSYTALIAATGRAPIPFGIEMALGFLEQMRSKQVNPETLTFNAALHACQSALHWAAAVEIFSEARRGRGPARLDSVSCAALLDSLAGAGSYGRFQAILPVVRRENLRSVILEPQADELKLLAGSMKPDLLALAARSATLSLSFWDPNQSWVDWGLVLVLLRRTVLGGARSRYAKCEHRETGGSLLRQLEELMTERRKSSEDRLLNAAFSHPFGLGPFLANLTLEALDFSQMSREPRRPSVMPSPRSTGEPVARELWAEVDLALDLRFTSLRDRQLVGYGGSAVRTVSSDDNRTTQKKPVIPPWSRTAAGPLYWWRCLGNQRAGWVRRVERRSVAIPSSFGGRCATNGEAHDREQPDSA
ncbi:EMB2654 [Symbiodinium sp. CCMP2592]|nr:EMB2654 [Symbiodinium sp. CCMP2592]